MIGLASTSTGSYRSLQTSAVSDRETDKAKKIETATSLEY